MAVPTRSTSPDSKQDNKRHSDDNHQGNKHASALLSLDFGKAQLADVGPKRFLELVSV
jgi:hypothetical protein